MQEQERFRQYVAQFQARKENLENKFNQSNKPKYSFFPEEPPKKFSYMDAFLKHLNNYEKTTMDLIKSNPENAEFYKAHFKKVVLLLENIENKIKNSTAILSQDCVLIVPDSVPYKRTNWEAFEDVLTYGMWGADKLGVAGFVVGGIGGAIAVLSVELTAFPVAFLFGLITAIAGFIVGAIIGALLGLVVGLWVVPSLDKPLNNPYLKGKAFDCYWLQRAYCELKDAYAELYKKEGANDEVVEPDTSSNQTQAI